MWRVYQHCSKGVKKMISEKKKGEEYLLLNGYFTLLKAYRELKKGNLENCREELVKGLVMFEDDDSFAGVYQNWLKKSGEELVLEE